MKKLSISALIISIVALGIAIYAMTGGLSGAGTFVTSRSITSPANSTESVSEVTAPTANQPVSSAPVVKEVLKRDLILKLADDSVLTFTLTAENDSNGALKGAVVNSVTGSSLSSLVQAVYLEKDADASQKLALQQVGTSNLQAFTVQVNEFWQEALEAANGEMIPGLLPVWFQTDYLGSWFTLAQEDAFADAHFDWVLILDYCDFNPNTLFCAERGN